jgi:hypothetical protein
VLVQLFLGDGARAPLDEELEELESLRRQVYGFPVARKLTGGVVQDKLAKAQTQGGLPIRMVVRVCTRTPSIPSEI